MTHFPHLARWKQAIAQRPAVGRAYALAKEINPSPRPPTSDAERKILFGQDETTVK
jgi:GST-like protein